MVQKEINNADSHMTVQSLTVIKDINSKGLKTIKKELEQVKQSTAQFAQEQEDFWSNISSDGVIAINEKTLLKKEWTQIDQTYTAIIKLASESNLEDTEDVEAYKEKYNALRSYLYETLKLFDNMAGTTNIANRDKFNSFFADYYEAETEIQTKLAIGMVDIQGLRILDNLGVIGLKDEIAIYLGKLYQYVNNEWVLIPSGGYLGIKDSCPSGAIGQFFLAGDSDFYYPIKIKIGESFLQTTDGRFILATKKVEKGFIYAFTETGWVKIIDKNDYRYIIAINDLITLGESLSDNLQGIFNAINGRLDDAENSLKDKIEYVPSYLGMFEADPKDAKEGDWYVYNGVETTERNKGKVYLYQMNTAGTALSWEELNPADVDNSKYFMAALKDVLASMKAGPGYFSEVFCNVLFANSASISALQTQTISLSSGGMIKSNDETYEQYKTGMCIGADGNADFNGNTHIGGKLTVDGQTFVGEAAVFAGSIASGPLYLDEEDPGSLEQQINFESNTSGLDFFTYCEEQIGFDTVQNGTVTIDGKVYNFSYVIDGSYYSYKTKHLEVSFLDKKKNELISLSCGTYHYEYAGEPPYKIDDINLQGSIVFNKYTPGGKTFKLIGLPTAASTLAGVIYQDSEGYLRVSL